MRFKWQSILKFVYDEHRLMNKLKNSSKKWTNFGEGIWIHVNNPNHNMN